MEPKNLEHIRDLVDKELDEVYGGANPHTPGVHAVTAKEFKGDENAGSPGVWGRPEGHPNH
jgi:hypothetical protein